MTNTVERNELVRKQLEKKYTHVTFIKTAFEGTGFSYTVWAVGEDMQIVEVPESWGIATILVNLEMKEVVKIANPQCDKYHLFRKAMLEGVIEIDYTLYKKTTEKKLRQLLGM